MGDFGDLMTSSMISLNQDLVADLEPFVIPRAKTLSAIMNENFPDAFAISFVSHQIIIELKKVTLDEHCKRLGLGSLPIWISGTDVVFRYYNGPIHGRELNRPKPKEDKFQDEYDGTDYLKSQGCFHPGSMISHGDHTVFTAGIQVKRQQDIGVTVPISCWDKKFEHEHELPSKYCTVKQGDWENGTEFQVRTKPILNSNTLVATTHKPFNNRFTNLKGSASSLLHSDDIRKVNELFWTDSFMTGPHQLASVGKRVCKVDSRGNDLFRNPDAPEYGERVQCIYASSMPLSQEPAKDTRRYLRCSHHPRSERRATLSPPDP
ncbi:hypothetical protein VE03_00967 [Pseudogymnoascus sp. 23342-1-I1]|nr:hypothetical protein VE03_00967 [Pseudogymnoascus sp. 23342-1-I1]